MLSCSYKEAQDRAPFFNGGTGPRGPVSGGASSTVISKKSVLFII